MSITRLIVFFVTLFVSKATDKLAFMFLFHDPKGNIFFEKLWNIFFTWRVDRSQYNIYVHSVNELTISNTSVFYGNVIPTVSTAYGKTLGAQLQLLRTAIKDPNNQFFLLLSEFDIPLHPFQAMRSALLTEGKSVIDACSYSTDYHHRWRPEIETQGIHISRFRKSAQFWALIRKHAELFTNDSDVMMNAFSEVEFSMEHYYPTVLAFYNLSHETTCSAGFSYMKFDGLTPHPEVYNANQVSPALFEFINTNDICGNKFSYQCSGTSLCHFTARKFFPNKETDEALLNNIHLLLSDPYVPKYLYPNKIAQDIARNKSTYNCSQSVYLKYF